MSLDKVVDNYLTSPRGKRAVQLVGDHVARIYADEVEAQFGLRCKTFEPNCPTCKAWARYDRWLKGEDDAR